MLVRWIAELRWLVLPLPRAVWVVHGAKHSVELERENFGTSMCRRSVGFSIDAPQKVLLVLAVMSRCGPSTKAKHGLTFFGSKGSHQKLSTLSHLPVSGVVVIIGHVVRRPAQCHKKLRRMKTS